MPWSRPGRIALLLVLAAAPLAAQDTPAPEGYAWKKLDPIKASFLLPAGWHFKAERVDRALAYFLSEEDIDVKGEFETGLTLNVSHVEDARKRAVATLAMLAQAPGNEVQDAWETQTGVLKGMGARIRQTEKGSDPLVMVVLADRQLPDGRALPADLREPRGAVEESVGDGREDAQALRAGRRVLAGRNRDRSLGRGRPRPYGPKARSISRSDPAACASATGTAPPRRARGPGSRRRGRRPGRGAWRPQRVPAGGAWGGASPKAPADCAGAAGFSGAGAAPPLMPIDQT